MRIGLSVESFAYPGGTPAIGPTFAQLAHDADEAGLYSFWVMDHLFQIGNNGPPEDPMLEGYTALAFAAGQTTRIKLGTLVTAAAYRYPAMLVKTVTTLDALSGGRAYLGIGAAWNEMEARSLGIPFPALGERFDRLEETLQIALQMWAGDQRPFDGRHYHMARPINSPNSMTVPHVPLLIGGGGEQRTLRLVARYADASNLFAFDDASVARKLRILADHCAEIGRPYEEIEKTAYTIIPLSRTPSRRGMMPRQALERVQQLGEMGIEHVMLGLQSIESPRDVDLLGQLSELAAPIVPAGRPVPASGG